MLDTGAHFYDTYETKDGKYLAVGAIEPQFYAELRRLAGLTEDHEFDSQMAFYDWPRLKEKLAKIIRARTRDAWMAIFDRTDACVAPVLSLSEAPHHAHNAARATFIEAGGITQPAPAPRFSATPAATPRMATGHSGADTDAILSELGRDAAVIAALKQAGIVG
jgi:alpha-methylacyl-CoA racemase